MSEQRFLKSAYWVREPVQNRNSIRTRRAVKCKHDVKKMTLVSMSLGDLSREPIQPTTPPHFGNV